MALWRFVCALAFLSCGISCAAMAGDFTTPERGSAERSAIMDAIRVPVEKELGPRVVFVVDQLRVGEGWAFLSGRPQRPSGAPIDYRLTPYAEDHAAGLFDDGLAALLQIDDGVWTVRALSIGHTDVIWETWAQDHGAPRGVFGW
ncbi:MAG: hypothetical protein AAFV69_07220 [Pseudomonadota bacterium]